VPGDVLEVRIREVRLRDDWGWNLILPLHGTLPEDFPEARRMHLPIDRRAMTARLPWGKEIPLRPFFGNFGVAPPARYGAIDSLEPREHGATWTTRSWSRARPSIFRSGTAAPSFRRATVTQRRTTARFA
jgi:acetamidase/formamidase